jgi:hypothetical protein
MTVVIQDSHENYLSNFPCQLNGGHNLRGFCPKCGSRLTGAENPEREIICLTASNLDDPSWFKPTMDIFVCNAQSWDLMDSDLPEHQQYMPR